MSNELREYVKIETTPDGFALVTVCMADQAVAVKQYFDTVYHLTHGKDPFDQLENKDRAVRVPNPEDYEIKKSNENTKGMEQVTVKGRGRGVLEDFKRALGGD